MLYLATNRAKEFGGQSCPLIRSVSGGLARLVGGLRYVVEVHVVHLWVGAPCGSNFGMARTAVNVCTMYRFHGFHSACRRERFGNVSVDIVGGHSRVWLARK